MDGYIEEGRSPISVWISSKLLRVLSFVLILAMLFLVFIAFFRMSGMNVLETPTNAEEFIIPEEPRTNMEKLDKVFEFEDEYLKRNSLKKRHFKNMKFNQIKYDACPNHHNRDFNTHPIRISGLHLPSPWDKICPVGCTSIDGNDGDVRRGKRSKDPKRCFYSFDFSMENVHIADFDITGTTSLITELPVQYYSWEVFQFFDEDYPKEKRNDVMMTAFISNCGATKRLKIFKELLDNGISIDSYGKCEHNKDEPKEIIALYPESTRQSVKKHLSATYKFIYSPENSETDDYVTEKFFLPFVVGSVPVYLGASNIDEFAPSPNSYVDIAKFETTKDLSAHLRHLFENEEAYNEMQKWRTEGPTRHFIDKMDFSIIHSSCRLCLRAADYFRVEYDNNEIGHEKLDPNLSHTHRYFRVRLRNTFYLSYVYIKKQDFSMITLIDEISRKLELTDFYKVYYLWDRAEIPIGNEELNNLKDGDELECVFIDANDGRRGSYDVWKQKKDENQKQIENS